MSPSKTINQNILHSLEIAYAIAFFVLLVYYVAGVTLVAMFSSEAAELLFIDRIYLIVVALILTAQLLRMYYHLKDFETGLAAPGTSHFLELLPFPQSRIERFIRVIIAVVLVTFSKVRHDAYLATAIGGLPIDLTPAITLACCFAFLLLWDIVVWQGFKRLSNNPNRNAWQTARRFYYLPPKWDSPSKIGPYFRELKFFERLCGLVAAIFAIVYVSTRSAPTMTGLVLFALLVPLIAYRGYQRSNLPPKHIKSGFDLFKLALLPVVSLMDIYEGTPTMNSTNFNLTRSRTYKAIAGILVLFAIFLIWQWRSTPTEKKSVPLNDSTRVANTGNPLTPVRIATSKNLWCALTLIANEKGFFFAEGLKAELNIQAAGRLNMDALLGGTVDIANVVETNIAYQALNRTSNLAIHSRIVSATDYAIITRASSLIRSASDLRGKNLAYAQATGAESFVFWFLEKEAIPQTSIKLIPLQPAGIVDHFLAGKTDAVATWEPFVSTIRKRSTDLGRIFYAEAGGFTGIMVVATKRDWAETRRSVLHAYDNAMTKAARFVADSAGIAQKVISEQTGLPLETVVSAWPRFDFSYVPTSETEIRLVEGVVRRIQIMLPEMRAREPQDIHSYFRDLYGAQ